jgi:hypothetical protein
MFCDYDLGIEKEINDSRISVAAIGLALLQKDEGAGDK